MTISQRQFTLLSAMGIPLWRQKRQLQSGLKQPIQLLASFKNNGHNEAQQVTSVPIIELKVLSQQQLFKEIIFAFGASLEEISLNNNVINLGLLQWQFSENKAIILTENLLSTPELAVLAKSPSLKRQLWQTMVKYQLLCR